MYVPMKHPTATNAPYTLHAFPNPAPIAYNSPIHHPVT